MVSRILAIDTVTPACSVALFDDDKLLASEYQEIGRGHAEKLIPMITKLPEKGKADQIIVNCGPGSFTGVRIGLSAAKALAMAWGSQLSGYQCLNLVAAQALEQKEEAVCVAMTGGHSEYFVQNFDASGQAVDDLKSLPIDAAQDYAKSALICGSAAIELTEPDSQREGHAMYPQASKTHLLPDDAKQLPIAPIYGRPPDAKPA